MKINFRLFIEKIKQNKQVILICIYFIFNYSICTRIIMILFSIIETDKNY